MRSSVSRLASSCLAGGENLHFPFSCGAAPWEAVRGRRPSPRFRSAADNLSAPITQKQRRTDPLRRRLKNRPPNPAKPATHPSLETEHKEPSTMTKQKQTEYGKTIRRSRSTLEMGSIGGIPFFAAAPFDFLKPKPFLSHRARLPLSSEEVYECASLFRLLKSHSSSSLSEEAPATASP